MYRIVFGTDTRAGKLFDIVLLWLIVASVIVVVLESMPELRNKFSDQFYTLEVFFYRTVYF